MRSFRLSFLFFCHTALLLLLSGELSIVAAQQCRLVRPSAATETASGSNNAASPSPSSTSVPPSNVAPSPTPFQYGQDPIRGVNLGGWLVLEPWITPSIFQGTNNEAIIDEYTMGQMLDAKTAQATLQNHWKTWITEDDFIAIKAAGLNHVRIPLGYWSVPLTPADTNTSTSVDPYITGAWPYLLQGIGWAQKHGIHVILDLHGAPGSQNGYDNSGQRTGNPQWALQPANVQRTLDTIQFIVKQLGGQVDVIELLNEAAGFFGSQWAQVIRQYWQDGYNVVREAAGSGIKVMIGDAFLGVPSWSNFLTAPSAQGVLMDYHEYQIFSDTELDRSWDQHVQFTCQWIPTLSSFAQSNIWTVVGEWSTAITDCAQWLNGRNVGARWDGSISQGAQYHGSCTNFTGSYQGFSSDYKTFLRRYWEAQVDVGESVQGWVYWTWKAENADEWSYQKGLEGGWIPQDPAERQYPGMCSQ
ncbi:glycoside hydrolase family 5 protein [Amanita muscaria Koide BX008]|uniref:Glycoside hydrolase family 5 protein n=1 Tax=Amanita muscaria (strain Koide BX008) TaxID=946122 RepID=A0A0C2X0H7_AMAMK|nr:glycoside hydrolase family 5 protein [Amanita muscaria Koide BX008]